MPQFVTTPPSRVCLTNPDGGLIHCLICRVNGWDGKAPNDQTTTSVAQTTFLQWMNLEMAKIALWFSCHGA